jgi:tRNA/tmRNA/rRNA uracil-C5-methylase (TrmA/RlmC/RlmD family)
LLGVRFRISPETFFQTNSQGAQVLYTLIGDYLGLPNVDKNNTDVVIDAQPENVSLTFGY